MRFWLLISMLTGCGGATALPEPNEYVGCSSDEQWRTFDDRENAGAVMISSTEAPVFTQPATGATLLSSMRPTLKWLRATNDPGMPDGDVPHTNGPGCNLCCPQFNLGGLQTLHLPPISGDVYDLQFKIGGAVVWRALTTLQEWAPPTMPPATSDPWPAWRGKTITVSIVKMDVQTNDLKAGPFAPPAPLSFSVGN